jgi:release factor glutamine methyltransferase
MTGNHSSPGMPDRTPVRAVLARAAAALEIAGLPSPRVDAELLAAAVLGIARNRLLIVESLDDQQRIRYEELVARRAAGVPLQHLTGKAGFRYLELVVGPGVFVPRPETELLVDWGLAVLVGHDRPVVVDLCAGSGAIGLAVAQERPDAGVFLVESDPVALGYLRQNVKDPRVTSSERPGGVPSIVPGDATDPALLAALDGTVDLVLCNPPYLPAGTALPADVAGTAGDPAAALYGGPDGLAVVRPLVHRIAALLRPGGAVGIEHADTQGAAVPALLAADGRFSDPTDHPDLTNRPRFTTATRTTST